MLIGGSRLSFQGLEQRRRHEHDANPGGCQAQVNLAQERLSEADLVLAEPDRRAEGDQQVAQLSRGAVPVVPSVAEEEIATLGVAPRLRLDVSGEGLDRAPLGGGVRHRPPSAQATRLATAAGRPAPGRPAAVRTSTDCAKRLRYESRR